MDGDGAVPIEVSPRPPAFGRAVRFLTPRLIKQVVPYLAGAQSKRFAPIIFKSYHPFSLNLMEAIQSTDPANFRNFNLVIWQLKDCERGAGDENETLIRHYASEKVREACINVFSRHSENVFQALVLHYMNGQTEEIVPVIKYTHGLLRMFCTIGYKW